MSGGAHLSFEILPKRKSRKTEIWAVMDQNGSSLGEVRWWASWRRYTFHPAEDTLYDPGCLRQIADFCEEQTKERRKAREAEA